MGNNYNGFGNFINNNWTQPKEAFFVDKTGKKLAEKNRNFVRFPSQNKQRSETQNVSADDANTESTEGVANYTPVAPAVEVHNFGEPQARTPEHMNEMLETLTVMDQDDILRGIIMAEILKKPKALRRGRW